MYVCNYNNVCVRKYISLSIPLVHNSWAARSVSQVSIQLRSCLVKNRQYFMRNFVILSSISKRDKYKFLYFPRYENETSINFYTFLDMETRQVYKFLYCPRYENEAVSRQERLTNFRILFKILILLSAGALAQRYVSRLSCRRFPVRNRSGRPVSVYFFSFGKKLPSR